MAITVSQVNSTSDTFNVWLSTTNQLANLMSNVVVTANGSANGSLTTGNAYVNGIFASLTLTANTLRGGNVQSTGLLTISTNAQLTGTQFAIGNSTVNAVSNSLAITLSNSSVTYTLQKPTASQKAGSTFYLNANGSWTNVFATSPNFSGTISAAGFRTTNTVSNVSITNTGIIFSNTTASAYTMIQPTSAQQDGAHYLNANGSWVAIFAGDPVLEGNVTADSFIAGNSTVNSTMNNSSISISNTTTSIVITNPTSAEISGGDYYLNANGDWVDIFGSNITVTGTVTGTTSLKSGTGTTNATLSTSSLTLTNSSVTFTLSKPTSAQQSAGDTFLNADGTWDAIGTSNSSGFSITGNLYATDNRLWANNIHVDGDLRGGNVTTSEVLNITSNVAITGTKLSVGTGSVNSQINSTAVTLANSTVTFSLDRPTAAEQSDGDYFLNADGLWTKLTTSVLKTITTSGTGAQIIDSWDNTTFWGAEYTIVTEDNSANNRQMSRLMCMHNGDAFLTEYAVLISNNDMGVYSANVSGSTVRLYYTPVSGSVDVSMKIEFVPLYD